MSDLRIAIVTCSDSCAAGTADDEAGRAIIEACEARDWLVVAYHVCSDEMECISTSLMEMSDMEDADVVMTVGGTGLGPRDVTPEATSRVIERPVPGIAEMVRDACRSDETYGALSRGIAGMRGRNLIINLPGGGTARALASFEHVAPLFEGAVAMIRGDEQG